LRRRGQALRLYRLIHEAHGAGKRILVLGVGNELRGDDAVGSLVAADLAALGDERFESVPVGIAIENASHLPVRRQADLVVLIDAAVMAKERLRAWRVMPVDSLDTFCHTTHSIPLSLIVQYWQKERPGLEVCFVGIGLRGNEFAAAPSPEVARAREEIVGVITAALGRTGPRD
jgi:hydrogenase 3 maturation protease